MIAKSGSVLRLLQGAALAGIGLAMAGCSTTTYGTGVGPMTQTLVDLSNIVDFSRDEFIQYCQRQGIVVPPTFNLPPPGAPTPLCPGDVPATPPA